MSILPVSFAATQDIGEILFRDILKMTEYPGAPFTGNIMNDVVMFFFIPTVFLIIVIYTLVGRLTDTPKMNLLMSIAFYVFVIFGGYFRIFALLAGPYFIFLLVFLGLFMFFVGHFGLRRAGGGAAGGAMSSRALGGGMAARAASAQDLMALTRETKMLTAQVRTMLRPGSDTRYAGDAVARLEEAASELEEELRRVGGISNFLKSNPIQRSIAGQSHLNPQDVLRDARDTIRRATS